MGASGNRDLQNFSKPPHSETVIYSENVSKGTRFETRCVGNLSLFGFYAVLCNPISSQFASFEIEAIKFAESK